MKDAQPPAQIRAWPIRKYFALPRVRVRARKTTLLLNFAQLLRDPHAQQDQNKDTGSYAEYPDRHPEPIDLDQQLRLLFLHVRVRIVQKELIVFMHCERAAIDEQDD
jgi:hypothetical protein